MTEDDAPHGRDVVCAGCEGHDDLVSVCGERDVALLGHRGCVDGGRVSIGQHHRGVAVADVREAMCRELSKKQTLNSRTYSCSAGRAGSG